MPIIAFPRTEHRLIPLANLWISSQTLRTGMCNKLAASQKLAHMHRFGQPAMELDVDQPRWMDARPRGDV